MDGSTTGSNVSVDRFDGPCGLARCLRNPCTLATHHAYQRQPSPTPQTAAGGSHSQQKSAQSIPQLTELSYKTIEPQITDGLPEIPFKTQFTWDIKNLLSHYMTNQIHRLARIFVPHQDPDARLQVISQLIYSNQTMCICIVANSQIDRVMQSRMFVPDQLSELVYAITVKILRERINNCEPPDIDWLLLMVIALSGFECAFNRPDGLRAHRRAIGDLVVARGGIHATGHLISYIENADRSIALFLGEYPLYQADFPLARPDRPLGKYGVAFAHLFHILDQAVIEFSQDQCRLIHMLDEAGINLMTAGGPTLSDLKTLPYFLYLRDRISAQHARLHALYHENQVVSGDSESAKRPSSISRCVVLAGHIAFYPACFGDYYTVIRPMLGNELRLALQRKPRSDWTVDPTRTSIVIWLLFVLATIPKWEHHQWVLQQLRSWLEVKYSHGSASVVQKWSDRDWKNMEIRTLRTFVWSDLLYARTYRTVCDEVTNLDPKDDNADDAAN